MAESNGKKLERLEQIVAQQYAELSGAERLARFLAASAADNDAEAQRLVQTCPEVTYTGGALGYTGRLDAAKLVTLGVAGHLHHLAGQLQMTFATAELLDTFLVKHRAAAAVSFADGWLAGQGNPGIPVRPGTDADADADADDVDGDAEEDAEDEMEDGDGNNAPSPEAWHEGVDRAIARADLATKRLQKFMRRTARAIAGHLKGCWQAWDAFATSHLGVSGDVALRAWCPKAHEEFQQAMAFYPDAEPNAKSGQELTEIVESGWRRQTRNLPHA